MSQTTLNSKVQAQPAFELNAAARELVAAMPIVIFFEAIRAAFQRSAGKARVAQ
ncbi:hypothetical protein BH11PSE9_BH11PSE9_11420 [soil metagenome]